MHPGSPTGLPRCAARGNLYGMKTTIDSAGRLVIPKAIRDALGLSGGSVVELRVVGNRIEIVPAPLNVRLERRGRFTVAVPERDVPALTNDVIEAVKKTVREERAGT